MDYETEEQQLEAIKKWWKENAIMLVGGVVVGVAGIFGWQSYQQQTIKHAEEASIIYEQVSLNVQDMNAVNDQLIKVNKLEAEYADTPYASLSALLISKQQMASGEFAKAQQQLQWVIENAKQDEIKYLAKLRMARLFLSTDKADQAFLIASESFPESFQAMALELKGDALLIQGNADMARQAYTQAKAISSTPSRWLQLKIDDIGETSKPQNDIATEPSA